jgi:hypothetical protein
MIFKIIFEILLLFFHSANSVQFLKGHEENILAFRNRNIELNAEANSWFKMCRLKKYGVQICQVILEEIYPYSATTSCSQNNNLLKYGGNGRACQFTVSNLQHQGNKKILICFSST